MIQHYFPGKSYATLSPCDAVRTVRTLIPFHKPFMQRGEVTFYCVCVLGCKRAVRALVISAALVRQLQVKKQVALGRDSPMFKNYS
jgi:hypothetical protein